MPGIIKRVTGIGFGPFFFSKAQTELVLGSISVAFIVSLKTLLLLKIR